ncbi:signal peptidase I [Halosegnis longus]|uniref:Signal peptidase I n=2 Tax=Halosegnis longus TaxID=2216012 RepID=A0AAJ4UUJ7_9EURY|nr:signal peptidase I [Salella cibi]
MRSALSSSDPVQFISSKNIELFVTLGLVVLIFAGFWKMFEKAGKPGWAGIVPIYNLYVLVKISGNTGWWFILFFIPVINFFSTLKISIDIAGKFNKGVLFGIGLTLFSFIFYPLLGFGDYQYDDATTPDKNMI